MCKDDTAGAPQEPWARVTKEVRAASPGGGAAEGVSIARTTPRARVVAAGMAGLAIVAGCGSPSVDTAGCIPVPGSVLTAISAELTDPGALQHGQAHRGKADARFVSAVLSPPDADDPNDGDIYTWSTTDGRRFRSVDVRARQGSTWPEGELDVRDSGAVASRACADEMRDQGEDGGQGDCPAGTDARFCRRGGGG